MSPEGPPADPWFIWLTPPLEGAAGSLVHPPPMTLLALERRLPGFDTTQGGSHHCSFFPPPTATPT